MAPRGPKPEPASVKRAKGNSGRRRIGDDPVVSATPVLKVPAPAWLKGEPKKVWDRIAPKLVAMKLLTPTDVDTFGRYCVNFARWLKMQKIMEKEGETYESESAHGKLKRAHPAFMIADRLDRKLESSEDRFGLNPADRQRIFASRAAAGATGGLFDQHGGTSSEPKTEDIKASQNKSAVGMLN